MFVIWIQILMVKTSYNLKKYIKISHVPRVFSAIVKLTKINRCKIKNKHFRNAHVHITDFLKYQMITSSGYSMSIWLQINEKKIVYLKLSRYLLLNKEVKFEVKTIENISWKRIFLLIMITLLPYLQYPHHSITSPLSHAYIFSINYLFYHLMFL